MHVVASFVDRELVNLRRSRQIVIWIYAATTNLFLFLSLSSLPSFQSLSSFLSFLSLWFFVAFLLLFFLDSLHYTSHRANSYRFCKGCQFEICGRSTVLFHGLVALHNHVQAMMHLRTKTSHIKGVYCSAYKPNQLGFPLHDMEKVWWYLFSFSPAACIHCIACFSSSLLWPQWSRCGLTKVSSDST